MTPAPLASLPVAANPGPAAHLAMLGVIVILGLIVFALVRRRRRSEQTTVDEPSMRDLTNDHTAGHERQRHPHQ